MTSADRFERARSLFVGASERSKDTRRAWLEAQCANDHELLREIEDLLERSEAAGAFGATASDEAAFPRTAQAADSNAQSAAHPRRIGGYEILHALGSGGMGTVYAAEQKHPRRKVALKVLREGSLSEHARRRFEYEAELLGRLRHPGIAHIYEAGVADSGFGPQPFLAMELVDGRALASWVAESNPGLRAKLELFVELCLAVQHAHERGVIHRDLKPDNILVENDGKPKVLDFGIGRAIGADVGVATRLTEAGAIIGTLPYMSPERLADDPDAIDTRSDVYSLGVILHELVSGRRPHDLKGLSIGKAIEVIRFQDPAPLSATANVVRDLEIIAAKAIDRDPIRRYASAAALADDVQRFLRDEAITARPASTLYQIRKLVRRHRAFAIGFAAVFLMLVLGLSGTIWQARNAEARRKEAEHEKTVAEEHKTRAEINEKVAQEQERIATKKARDVLSLSAIQELKELVEKADDLWPAMPEKVQAYDDWLADAKVLIEGRSGDPAHAVERHPGLKDHESNLAEIRKRAKRSTMTDEMGSNKTASRSAVERETVSGSAADRESTRSTSVDATVQRADLESDRLQAPSEPRAYEFDDAQDRWWHAQLAQLVLDLHAFTDEKTGLFSEGTSPDHAWGIARRRKEAATIGERSVSGTEAKRRWSEASEAIAKSEKYAGLKLVPQVGLLPIGSDPSSGLWEFALLETGAPAERGADGKLELTEEMGLIFVLIPGGSFWMGAQKTDASGRHYDLKAQDDESPLTEVKLDAYFLSKYEMTQGQWLRLTGHNPSQYKPGSDGGNNTTTLLNPVEWVSWLECQALMSRQDLLLPTEAQWEYAARGGTETPWWTGEDVHSLDGAANLLDSYLKNHGGMASWVYEDWLNDGFAAHAPVGSFRANPFGLHDVLGNVIEWCRDGYDSYSLPLRAGDGERHVPAATRQVARGGSFYDAAADARSATRVFNTPENRNFVLGLRPAKSVQR